MTATTIRSPEFEAALDANPTDWATHLVYADWLDEPESPDDAAIREQIDRQRRERDAARQQWALAAIVVVGLLAIWLTRG